MEQTITLWTTIATLFAIVVGFGVSIYTTTKQVRAQVVSVNRQNWINHLRQLTAEYLAVCNHLRYLEGLDNLERFEMQNTHSHEENLELDWDQMRERGLMDMKLRYQRIRNEIALMLNPGEESHKVLLQQLTRVDYREDPQVYQITHQAFGDGIRDVLKTEWEKVKAGR